MAFKIIKQDILNIDAPIAEEVREKLADKGILMVNIISSPGSGKTSIIEAVAPKLKREGIELHVITGDCFTAKDAERLESSGIVSTQIDTQGACHINAAIIKKAIDEFEEEELKDLELLIIENVGNLVCPADFDLGEDIKIVVISTTEGNDKPLKYVTAFSESRLCLVNKIDLLPHVDFDITRCARDIKSVNADIKILALSAKTGEGLEYFTKWIKDRVILKRKK